MEAEATVIYLEHTSENDLKKSLSGKIWRHKGSNIIALSSNILLQEQKLELTKLHQKLVESVTYFNECTAP